MSETSIVKLTKGVMEGTRTKNDRLTYYSMKSAPFVALGDSLRILVLASAEPSKVFRCCWHNIHEEFHLYAANRLSYIVR